MENKLLNILILFAVLIILLYEFSYDMPELYHNADRHFYILYQIAMGIIGSFIFFIIQSYIPQKKKNKYLSKFFIQELDNIKKSMQNIFEELSIIYLGVKKENGLTDENLRDISCSLNFRDPSLTCILPQSTSTIYEIIKYYIDKIELSVDNIIQNYSTILSEEEVKILFDISNSKFHSFLKNEGLLYTLTGLSYEGTEMYKLLKEYNILYFCLYLLFIQRGVIYLDRKTIKDFLKSIKH